MEELKFGDYVKLKNGKTARIQSVNDFRPPETKYAVDIVGEQLPDLVFIGDEDIDCVVEREFPDPNDLFPQEEKEEEIKVGEYVRTNRGMISKVIEIRPVKHKEKDTIDDAYILEKGNWTIKQLIVSHSPNLIDLIEKGDYVNGERVLVVNDIITDNGEKAILVENYDEWTDDGVITNKDIKSVVTHEQFAQIEYKVEE